MHGLLSCEVLFFRVLQNKRDSWSYAQTLPSYKKAAALAVTKSQKREELSVGFLQVSRSLNESTIQQELSNRIASTMLLSVRLDWHNSALALAAQISIAELPLTTFGLITSGK